ncbi:hypothetical protein [Noviherbaspirillum autotrophicum]|uniref:Lipoprotein n=1 Tax=Noviherbaspirillum autotrophicum TaxID=709839 RepID=A0A0C1Y1U9_9BURK|nr:hypothetical protein [Noviherbaspirillum autotrophicum]KIF81018.1 hypothetical protein TSA66_09650 [Noviherbaspirillum autotrophicum]
MNSMKLFVICAFGVVITTGCASSSKSPAVAAAQPGVQSGKVTAVESVAVVDQSVATTSSGSSAVVTTASGGPEALTVLFADGSQQRYIIERPTTAFKVGEPVNVITNGERITIVAPK